MKPSRLLTLALMALALPLAAQQLPTASDAAPTPGTGTFTSTLGIEYATARGNHLLVDMYVPDEPGLHPAILYLHTGAWITGDRDPGASLRQARRGYVPLLRRGLARPSITLGAGLLVLSAAPRRGGPEAAAALNRVARSTASWSTA